MKLPSLFSNKLFLPIPRYRQICFHTSVLLQRSQIESQLVSCRLPDTHPKVTRKNSLEVSLSWGSKPKTAEFPFARKYSALQQNETGQH